MESHPVFKAKNPILGLPWQLQESTNQISVADVKIPNLFVPELTLFSCVVAEYGVCENLRKLEITGVSCQDVYAKRK